MALLRPATWRVAVTTTTTPFASSARWYARSAPLTNDELPEKTRSAGPAEDSMAHVTQILDNAPSNNIKTADHFTARVQRPQSSSRKPSYTEPPSTFVTLSDFKNKPKPDTFRARRLRGPSRAESVKLDLFHQHRIDPLHEATNPSLLSFFMTEMGKIMPRSQTGLTIRSQRRLAAAIRRARSIGLLPNFYKDSVVVGKRKL